jgi:hypothetical protein
MRPVLGVADRFGQLGNAASSCHRVRPRAQDRDCVLPASSSAESNGEKPAAALCERTIPVPREQRQIGGKPLTRTGPRGTGRGKVRRAGRCARRPGRDEYPAEWRRSGPARTRVRRSRRQLRPSGEYKLVQSAAACECESARRNYRRDRYESAQALHQRITSRSPTLRRTKLTSVEVTAQA